MSNNNQQMKPNSQWLLEFTILITITALLSGIAYYIQYYKIGGISNDPYASKFKLMRMFRMILLYVIPSIWFTYRWKGNLRDLGIFPSKSYPYSSFIGGILVYCVAVYVFVEYQIFFGGRAYTPWKYTWINLAIVGTMAMITDFWTRGFILFQVNQRYGEVPAIIVQNLVWFVIHIYEIDLLTPYIGIMGAIMLTLFLGITGDIIALKTGSIQGLMVGHIILNLSLDLGAKGYLWV